MRNSDLIGYKKKYLGVACFDAGCSHEQLLLHFIADCQNFTNPNRIKMECKTALLFTFGLVFLCAICQGKVNACDASEVKDLF